MNTATFEAIRGLIDEQRVAVVPYGNKAHIVRPRPADQYGPRLVDIYFRSFCEKGQFSADQLKLCKVTVVDHRTLCRPCLRRFLGDAYLDYLKSNQTKENDGNGKSRNDVL